MYKRDIQEAVRRLALSPGSALDGLLTAVVEANPKLSAAVAEVASTSNANIRTSCEKVQHALQPIAKRLSEISPSATAIELHQLSSEFDEISRAHPELEGVLQPGRGALAALSGAFDVALQQQRRASSLVGIVAPSLALGHSLDLYRGLSDALSDPASLEKEGAQIEVVGAEQLQAFARFISLMSSLADLATTLVVQTEEESIDEIEPVWISAVESGSPIRISLVGNGKALELLAAMLRDVARVSYQHLSRRGRAVQAMETFNYARQMGIESKETLAQLEIAMIRATQAFADSIEQSPMALRINGKPAPGREESPLLEYEAQFEHREVEPPKLTLDDE